MTIASCPACQSTNVHPLFNMGSQPLSLVTMQSDPMASTCLPRHPLYLGICEHCTHIHNLEYLDHVVPYGEEGCRMFNAGSGWQSHLDEVRTLLLPLADSVKSIIEIGAGDCEFLASLEMDAEKFAVDPCSAVHAAEEYGIAYEQELFDPGSHLPSDDEPCLVMMRHLLEHMERPRDLMEQLSSALSQREVVSWIYIEVPCCENALKHRRIEDWTYEHPQHFTVESMKALLHACNLDHFMILPKYGGEVLSVLVQVEVATPRQEHMDVGMLMDDYERITNNIEREREWIESNLYRIAFWGGAGKSAMFLRRMGVPDTLRSVVVDSHEEKWGMYVPGTKIQILPPATLRDIQQLEYIIATTSWRANDIRDEIVRYGYPCKTLLKFEGGELTEVPLGR
jgi:hypothetical protein